jgi:hypothetical protein
LESQRHGNARQSHLILQEDFLPNFRNTFLPKIWAKKDMGEVYDFTHIFLAIYGAMNNVLALQQIKQEAQSKASTIKATKINAKYILE